MGNVGHDESVQMIGADEAAECSARPKGRRWLGRHVEGWWCGTRCATTARLLETGTAFLRTAPREGLGQGLAEMLCQTLGWRGVALYLDDPGSDAWKCFGAVGPAALPFDLGAALPRADGSPGAERRRARARGSGTTRAIWMTTELSGRCRAVVVVTLDSSRAQLERNSRRIVELLAGQVALLEAERSRENSGERPETAGAPPVHACADSAKLRREIRSVPGFNEIIGSSPTLLNALAVVESVAATDASVLITGETGTGKELIARAVHALSQRQAGPLVSVNCPAIPRPLAESELFGHERGAFTDAVEARPGKFELADGGTIFLDEVADLPLEVQVKLLRVLQEREVQRIGSRKMRKLTLRVIAATNRDLAAEIRAQRFREDLYYRLATVVVHMPALRERGADVPMLAMHFLDRAAGACGRRIDGFTAEAIRLLCRYPWPGNVRQLQNIIERAVLLCRGEVITAAHLGDLSVNAANSPTHLTASIRDEKRRRIRQALEQAGGKQAAAARLLGISRSNLGRMMRTLGVSADGLPDSDGLGAAYSADP